MFDWDYEVISTKYNEDGTVSTTKTYSDLQARLIWYVLHMLGLFGVVKKVKRGSAS